MPARCKRVNDDSIPGYVVMAADVDAATRVLFQGLSAALTTRRRSQSSILSEKDRPWILLWNKGVVARAHGSAFATDRANVDGVRARRR